MAASGGAADLAPVHEDPSHVRRRRRLRARRPDRAQLPLRGPRARGGGDRQRHGGDEAPPLLVGVPDLLRLRPRRDPAVGADGDPGDPHLHPRLDRGRRGRARRTSRSSSSPRCGRCPACSCSARPTRTRSSRPGGYVDAAARASRRRSSSPARRCRRSTASSWRRASGVAQGAYVLADADGRRPGRDPAGHRLGGRRSRSSARDELAGDGIGARVVSMPCWELFDRQPREYRDQVLPPAVTGPGRDRAGVDARLGPLRRRRRRGRRHAHVRRVRAAEAAAQEVRLHARTRWPQVARDRVAVARARREEVTMKATEKLHEPGRACGSTTSPASMLDSGQIQRYIDNYSVTGLTSNPSIFDKAIDSGDYDDAIREKAQSGRSTTRRCSSTWRSRTCAAPPDMFLPGPRAHRRRRRLGVARGLAAARLRHRRDDRRPPRRCTRGPRGANLFIKIPGTAEGLPAITECDRRRRAGERHAAVLRRPVPGRGGRVHARRRAADRGRTRPAVGSVASVFMSRWDVAVADQVPDELKDQLGARRRARRPTGPTASSWTPTAGSGWRTPARGCSGCCGPARAPRTPTAPDTLYVHGLAAPFTDQHDARGDAARRSTTTARWASRCRPTAATQTRCCAVRRRRRRRRRARGEAADRRSEDVRRRLERPDGHHRPAVRGARRAGRSSHEHDDADSRRCGSARLEGLEHHYEEIRDVHLRELFAEDPSRGERLDGRGRRAVPRLLEEPDHRRDARLLLAARARSPALARAHARRCSAASGSTSPRTARCSTSRCGCRRARR